MAEAGTDATWQRVVRTSIRVARRATRGSYTVGSLVVVRSRTGYVLAVKSVHHSTWTFPGGFAKRHELPRTAAARELNEEARLMIEPEDLVDCGILFQTAARHIDCVYTVLLDDHSHQVAPSRFGEVRGVKWIEEHRISSRLNVDGERVWQLVTSAPPS